MLPVNEVNEVKPDGPGLRCELPFAYDYFWTISTLSRTPRPSKRAISLSRAKLADRKDLRFHASNSYRKGPVQPIIFQQLNFSPKVNSLTWVSITSDLTTDLAGKPKCKTPLQTLLSLIVALSARHDLK